MGSTISLEGRVGEDVVSSNEFRRLIPVLNENLRSLGSAGDALEAEVTRLRPFEIEANDLRPQIGPLQDSIRRKDEEIDKLRQRLMNMTQELDRAGEQFTFVQQQIAETYQQARKLGTQLKRAKADLWRESHRHGDGLCGRPFLLSEPDGFYLHLTGGAPRGDTLADSLICDPNTHMKGHFKKAKEIDEEPAKDVIALDIESNRRWVAALEPLIGE